MSDLQSELRRLHEIVREKDKALGYLRHELRTAHPVVVSQKWTAPLLAMTDAAAELIPPLIDLTALAAPAVKPFEWFVCNGGNSWYAITPFGNYNIDLEGSRYRWHVCFDEMHDEHEAEAPTLEAAQSAAWAHWCERIGGAIQ